MDDDETAVMISSIQNTDLILVKKNVKYLMTFSTLCK